VIVVFGNDTFARLSQGLAANAVDGPNTGNAHNNTPRPTLLTYDIVTDLSGMA
jgi:hypothetical protein